MNEEIIQNVDGKFYKKCKVVMLATEETTSIGTDNRSESYPKLLEYRKPYWQTILSTREGHRQNYNLYILSDEQIKEDDWYLFYMDEGPELMQCVDKEEADRCNSHHHIKHICKKIIATTDTSLDIRNKDFMSLDYNKVISILPRPSDTFIQKYVEEYNKGNIIEEVLVEYHKCTCQYQHDPEDCERIKIAPDNTITIKAVIETWDDIRDRYENSDYENFEFMKFLKENYQVPKKK